jgi:uncharacterized glyoxalase superfamily protein PhnB
MPAFQPRICYHDCSAAVDWLQRAFGFEAALVATREGQVVSAELRFGDARLTIGGEWENIKPPAALHGANTQIVHVVVDSGLDAHYDRARAAGATIVQEPTDMFHGERTYRVLDPQGHMWIFGQKLREVTNEELEAAIPGMKIARRV